jgi:ribosomal protein S7
MARHFKRPDDVWLKPDPRFQDKILSKFINCVMIGGEKATAQRCVYGALDAIQARLDKEKSETLPRSAIELFHLALENVRPAVEVRSKRVGGANYQVPMQLNKRRQQSLSFRWIIEASPDAPSPGEGVLGCRQERRQGRDHEGKHAPHGGCEQGLRALRVVRALPGNVVLARSRPGAL